MGCAYKKQDWDAEGEEKARKSQSYYKLLLLYIILPTVEKRSRPAEIMATIKKYRGKQPPVAAKTSFCLHFSGNFTKISAQKQV
jgi:hypothetical protein